MIFFFCEFICLKFGNTHHLNDRCWLATFAYSSVVRIGRLQICWDYIYFFQREYPLGLEYLFLPVCPSGLAIFSVEVVNVIHDEFIIELPSTVDRSVLSDQLESIVVESMRMVVPDVKIKTEYFFSDRWKKG